MPQHRPSKVTRTPNGWETRIRFGNGQRSRFLICPQLAEGEAIGRALALSGLAEQLASYGRPDVAIAILKKGASAPTEKDFARVRKTGEGLASGKIVAELPAPPPVGGPTFRKFAERWTSGGLAREYPDQVREKRTAQDDIDRLENHVYPAVGSVPIASFSLAHGEEVMRKLPKGLSPTTRRHVAQVLSKVLKLGVYPAKLIAASPLPTGFLPRVADRKGHQHLYPSEDAALLRCAGVPLEFRMLYGVLAREGLRAGEAEQLTWGDLDLDRGAIRLDSNKTRDPRSWALNPSVATALATWKSHRGTVRGNAKVFIEPGGEPIRVDKLAGIFRGHLQKAGIDRQELFVRTEHRAPIRAHDLRATFITVSLACGRSETWVADRTGHQSSAMINRYRRTARSFAELNLGDMSPLAAAVFEIHSGTEIHIQVGQKVGQRELEEEKNVDEEEEKELEISDLAEVAEWQTRRIQNPLLARV